LARRSASTSDRERALRGILLRQYRENPGAYYALWALGDKAIPEQTRRDYYIDAASKSGRPPALYKWLGDRLLELDAFDEAVAAYENAVENETTHAATLLELGQQFDMLGRRDAALQALRRATTSDDPALLVSLSRALSHLGAVAEAVECLERAAATDDPVLLTEIADCFEHTARWKSCVDAYRRAAEQDRSRAEPSQSESFYHLRLGRALWHRGAPREALRELVAVRPEHGVPSRWRTGLVEELANAGRLASRADYFLVRSWLLSERRADGRPEDIADAAAALLAVARSAYPHLRRAGSAEWETEVPSRRPIGLRADRRFFPQLGETPAVVRMIEQDIPAIQARIRAELGAFVPGVRIQGPESFGRREYRILLHELDRERGRVPREVADPYGYMLERLEQLVRANLATFIDVQSVDSMLANWEHEGFPERQGIRSRVLPDAPSMRRFVQVVEELVREQVPIVDLDTILRTFDEENLATAPMHRAVNLVRQQLRAQLPGLDGRPLVPLPEPVEAALSNSFDEHGQEFVAFRDQELEHLRASVRKTAAHQASESFAFVVQDADLRFFADRLVELDCPSVPVLSAQEAEQDRPHGLLSSSIQLLSRSR
jgi:tetratricopeptide (TPR) repeat protein